MDAVNQLAEYSGWHVIIILVLVLFGVEAVLKAGSYLWGKLTSRIRKEDSVMDAVDEHDTINKKLDDLADQVNTISDAVHSIERQNKIFQRQIDELNLKNGETAKVVARIEENEKRIQNHLQNNTKAFIIQQYQEFVEKRKCIDGQSLEHLEACFECYKENGGNGHLDDNMRQIRELPRISSIGK